MNRFITLLLQATVVAFGIAALTFLLWAPHLEGRNAHATLFEIYFNDPFLAYAYGASVFFFLILYQTFRLLEYRQRKETVSKDSVKAVRTIKRCATTLIALITVPLLYLIIVRPEDDIAGGVAVGLFLLSVCTIIAIIAAVMERRYKKVIINY